MSPLESLETYSLTNPKEVLLIQAIWQDLASGEEIEDLVMVFKGFSSSLMRSTAADPDLPVLPPDVEIIRIDRLASPYRPDAPNYLEADISWEQFQLRYLAEPKSL